MLVSKVSACLDLHAVHVNAEPHVQLPELQFFLDNIRVSSRFVQALQLRERRTRRGPNYAERLGVLDQLDHSGLDLPIG